MLIVSGIAMGLVSGIAAVLLVIKFNMQPRDAIRLSVFLALVVMIPFFMRLMRSQKLSELELRDGETVIRHGAATMLGQWPGKYGWLYLTNKRLYFHAGLLNFHRKATEIPLPEIQKVSFGEMNFLMNRSFRIETEAGESYRFSSAARMRWPDAIKAALAA